MNLSKKKIFFLPAFKSKKNRKKKKVIWQMNLLLESTNETVPLFSLEGKLLPAKAVDIYDGDTATFCVLLNGEVCKFKMRLSPKRSS